MYQWSWRLWLRALIIQIFSGYYQLYDGRFCGVLFFPPWRNFMRLVIALLSGLILGLGLIVSGMTNPAKVIGFLDLFGAWDPSLMLVMGSAIPVTFFAFRYLQQKQTTLLNEELHLPGTRQIDLPLIIGSLLFGIGWAVAGYCPGPALVSLGLGSVDMVYFVLAMLIGMKSVDLVRKS
jgi:uncharacterized membrane protein YedE/YeeE